MNESGLEVLVFQWYIVVLDEVEGVGRSDKKKVFLESKEHLEFYLESLMVELEAIHRPIVTGYNRIRC